MSFFSKKMRSTADRLRRDQRGLTVPEMIMLAAFVLIPVIIAVGGFSKQILGSLSTGVNNTGTTGNDIKWPGSSGN